MMLDESKYHQIIDLLELRVEECIDEAGLDVDVDIINGILTLDFDDKGKIILSRQPALSQLWVAAKSGGYHLTYNEIEKKWYVLESDLSLSGLLTRLVSEQTGKQVIFRGV